MRMRIVVLQFKIIKIKRKQIIDRRIDVHHRQRPRGTRQLLVVSESFDPGWTARVDGQPARIHRVYGDFMGVVLEAGGHEVTLHFEPPQLRLGASLTALGLAGTAVGAGLSARRRG